MFNFWTKKRYDANLVVIGAGAAGLVSAYIAAAVKAKVYLVEKHRMGGDCLNTGCVPSKALIRAAKIRYQIQRAPEFGVNVDSIAVDFPRVMSRVKQVIADVEPHDSVERYNDLGVDCLQGEAKILSPHVVMVGDRKISTRHIIVATGARPAVPPIPGLNEVDYLSSDNLWDLQELPQKLLVLGGGPIGCELAQAFARLGSHVTLVDMAEKLLPRADDDVSQLLQAQFEREGIQLELDAKVVAVERGQNESQSTSSQNTLDQNTKDTIPQDQVKISQSGIEKTIVFDKILVAVGRQANTAGFGLEELGVVLNKNGTVNVDGYMRTNIKNILACGDVAGPYQFTHTASHQAWYASVNALFSGIKKFKADYSVIPWVIFTDPEVAHVGASESELTAQKIDFDIVKYDLEDLDRAIADGENYGFVKVLVKKGKDKILGATIVGSHAGEILAEFVAAMKNKKGLNSILATIHSYPTWSEANKYAAGVWKKNNAPQTILAWLARYHAFRRR